MTDIFYGFVIGSSIWVFFDARSIGVRPGLTRGLLDMPPWGWALGCLLLWIIVFPLYLIKRGDLKRAAEGSQPENQFTGSVSKDSLANLEKLAELEAKGIISEAEFEEKKQEILRSRG